MQLGLSKKKFRIEGEKYSIGPALFLKLEDS